MEPYPVIGAVQVKRHVFLDTQIISYAMKGKWSSSISGKAISSIVASELLLMHCPDPSKASWYLPNYSKERFDEARLSQLRRRDHPFRKNVADSLIVDFGSDFGSIVEFNSFSIARVINEHFEDLFIAATRHFPKIKRKSLLNTYRYLVDNGIECVPLVPDDIEHGFELLEKFKESHNLKQRFRNSWNDLLVLSMARNRSADLITVDSELARFSARIDDARVEDCDKGGVTLHYPQLNDSVRRKPTESKGYINQSWRVKVARDGL